MRALVTGGAGFIGSHLVDRLVLDGWHVTVVDNFDPFYDPAVKVANLAPYRRFHRVRIVEADIRDMAALQSRLSGDFDVIVHLAAKAGVRPSLVDPLAYTAVNVYGTQNLLELAREWETPLFIFGSSSSVYGVNPNVPWREDEHVLQPVSPYAATKVAGELLGHVYSHLYRMRVLALRFFTVFGPRQRPDLAIHSFAHRLLRGEPIPLYGDGASRRDYTFVTDIVEGICAAMRYDGSRYEVINLGNDHPIGLQEVVACLADALRVRPTVHCLAAQPGDVPQTWADITKARRLLGYAPAMSFADGIKLFATWLRQPAAA